MFSPSMIESADEIFQEVKRVSKVSYSIAEPEAMTPTDFRQFVRQNLQNVLYGEVNHSG